MKHFIHLHRRLLIFALAMALLSTTTVAWLDYTFGATTAQPPTGGSANSRQPTENVWFWYVSQWNLPQQ